MTKLGLRILWCVLLGAAAVPGYAKESYFYHGDSGFSTSFNLIGGQYSIYVHAQFVQNYKTHAPDSCIFAGNLQRVWPTRDASQLGGPAPIRNPIPYKLGPTPVTLAAGRYTFYVASSSDCEWHFSLESAAQNTTGVGELQMVKAADNGARISDTASVKDKIQFTAQYRTANDTPLPVSGEMQMLHSGKVFQTFPVTFGVDSAIKGSIAYVALQWEASDAKYAGRNTAKMVLKIGDAQYVTSTDFTLTP